MSELSADKLELVTEPVTMHTLKVSRKKLTISMFKQIPYGGIITHATDTTVELAGQPWGLVNYRWGDQLKGGLHVLWQKGGKLRRCIVVPGITSGDHTPFPMNDLVDFLDNMRSSQEIRRLIYRKYRSDLERYHELRLIKDFENQIRGLESASLLKTAPADIDNFQDLMTANYQLQKLIDRWREGKGLIENAEAELASLKASYDALYKELRDLPHIMLSA